MEAENFSQQIQPIEDSFWGIVYDPEYFSGDGAMQANPPGYEVHKEITDTQENSPILEYPVNFISTDTVYVWARASHLDGYDDSFWIGLDGLIEGTQPVSYTTTEQEYANEWYWIRYLMDEAIATINIPSTGLHVVQVYMREPSFKIDKLVLTTDEWYEPFDEDWYGPPETLAEATDIKISEMGIPEAFSLAQNYPNPFNPSTMINYQLPMASTVELSIYDLLGHKVATLVSERQQAGQYQVTWHAEGLPSGIYFYRLQAGAFTATKNYYYRNNMC
jgi:hypothetical protein